MAQAGDKDVVAHSRRWLMQTLDHRMRIAKSIIDQIKAAKRSKNTLHTESDPHRWDRLFSHVVNGIMAPEDCGFGETSRTSVTLVDEGLAGI